MKEQDNLSDASVDHEDLNTTPPNPAIEPTSPGNSVSGGWVMPKPVFRQSTGQPAVRENKYSLSEEDVTAVPSFTDDGSLDDTDEPISPEEVPLIAEAQPELADILPYEPEIIEPMLSEPVKNESSGMLVFVIGVILAIAFIALLLTVVYYLFLRPASDTGIF